MHSFTLITQALLPSIGLYDMINNGKVKWSGLNLTTTPVVTALILGGGGGGGLYIFRRRAESQTLILLPSSGDMGQEVGEEAMVDLTIHTQLNSPLSLRSHYMWGTFPTTLCQET